MRARWSWMSFSEVSAPESIAALMSASVADWRSNVAARTATVAAVAAKTVARSSARRWRRQSRERGIMAGWGAVWMTRRARQIRASRTPLAADAVLAALEWWRSRP